MVYVYKKIISGKPYYYLRASVRKNKKTITKDIAYLGSSISEVRRNLKNLTNYQKEIKESYRSIERFLEANYYEEKVKKSKFKREPLLGEKQEELEACKIHFNSSFKKKDELTKAEIFKEFLIEFAFNTTSIEGNTITLYQARNLLQEGLTPKNKSLREIYDLRNHEKVFFELLDTKSELSHDFIIGVHDKLLENIDIRKGYRNQDVRVFRARFKSSPGPYVRTDMELLLKWYRNNKNKLHPLVLATGFHHKFEKIHPFMDGNGRTGRMIFNYILMKNNFPPALILKKNRGEYIKNLEKADKVNLTEFEEKHYVHLVKYIVSEITNHYWDIFL